MKKHQLKSAWRNNESLNETEEMYKQYVTKAKWRNGESISWHQNGWRHQLIVSGII